ncbi:hypothetical protein EG68_06447 [Paragonimus skrjabini miyazakii]|uniref:Uncharacterized protein n=1 Tax=Paragonimus skrjabini miyazakii TaxID=59628 RepID=A0A8S9YL95_9TREM|nr:hypothetical protein EG68_06447 [Paragonimus skrjabini miyazakii]
MPHHEYSTLYPNMPNNNADYRFIRFNASEEHNESFIGWMVNYRAKVIYFKAHDLQTGQVQFECEVVRVAPRSCCVQNVNQEQSNIVNNCDQSVYNHGFAEKEYRVVYHSRQRFTPLWNSLIVNIFVQTTQGSRRFFFGWPGKIDKLVCSEISRTGHDGSDKRLVHLLSSIETNTIEYDMFEHNHIHVDPGTVITLRIRSFARPGEQTIAYLFRYDEQTRVLDRVSAEQPIEPVQVDADVRMFTERIQLMDNYESRIRKHVFRFKVHAMDRAILLLTCKHREQDLRVIDDLMNNWIVRGNKSVQFRWMHTHSPGIRLVRLSTARYSVVEENETVHIRVVSDPSTNIACFKSKSIEGPYRLTSRLTKKVILKGDENKLLYVQISSTSMFDSGLYKCENQMTKEIVLRDHWVIVLPTRQSVSIALTRSIQKYLEIQGSLPEEEGTILLTGTPITVACVFHLPDGYDTYNEMRLIHEYVRLELQEPVQLEKQVQSKDGSTRTINLFYQIKTYFTDDYLDEQRLVCTFEYIPQVGLIRTDFITNPNARLIQAERRVFYVPDDSPYIIGSSIQTSLPKVTKYLRSINAKHRDLYNFLVADPVQPFDGTLTGEFVAVHYDSIGWGSVWTSTNCAQVSCQLNYTQMTATHPLSRIQRGGFSHPVYNRVMHYHFSCPVRKITTLVILNVFNRLIESVDRPAVSGDYQRQFCELSQRFDPKSLTLFGKLTINDVYGTESAHRIVPIGKKWFGIQDKIIHPAIFNEYIQSTSKELLENFLHTGQQSLRAVDFHRSGSQKRWMERNAEISVVQYLGKPNAHTALWTFRMVEKESKVQMEECHKIDSRPLTQQNMPNELKQQERYRLTGGMDYVNVSFICTFQPEDHIYRPGTV